MNGENSVVWGNRLELPKRAVIQYHHPERQEQRCPAVLRRSWLQMRGGPALQQLQGLGSRTGQRRASWNPGRQKRAPSDMERFCRIFTGHGDQAVWKGGNLELKCQRWPTLSLRLWPRKKDKMHGWSRSSCSTYWVQKSYPNVLHFTAVLKISSHGLLFSCELNGGRDKRSPYKCAPPHTPRGQGMWYSA